MYVILLLRATETAVPTAGLDVPLGVIRVSLTVGLLTVKASGKVQLLVTGPTTSVRADPTCQGGVLVKEPHPPLYPAHEADVAPEGGVIVYVTLPPEATETAVPAAGLDVPLGVIWVSLTVGAPAVKAAVTVQLPVAGAVV